MKIAVLIVRVLIGILFLLSSIVVLFNLIPPPELEGPVKVFNEGIEASVYLVPLLKVTELICAIAFLSGRFVSLASIVIVPVTVNIFLYHAFIAHDGLAIGLFLLAGNLFLLYFHRNNYQTLLSVK